MNDQSKDQLELAFLRLQRDKFKAFAQLAIEMLAAQKLYFKTRDKQNLMTSLQLEKKLGDQAAQLVKGE